MTKGKRSFSFTITGEYDEVRKGIATHVKGDINWISRAEILSAMECVTEKILGIMKKSDDERQTPEEEMFKAFTLSDN